MTNDRLDPRSSGDSSDDTVVPPELQLIHQWLVQDGAAWRARVPPAESAVVQARQRLLTVATAQRSPIRSANRARAASMPATWPLPRSARSSFIATSAALLLVGLIGAVLYGVAGHHPAQTGVSTPSAVAGPTSVPNRWEPVQALSGQPGVPMLAPSDSRVVYVVRSSTSGGASTLARSDDGGASWHELTLPQYQDAPLLNPQVRLNPVDANIVFLQDGVAIPHFTPTSCDHLTAVASTGVQTLALLSDSGACYLDYMSTDGGAHWRGLVFPIRGSMLQGGYSAPLSDVDSVQMQGARIFLTLTDTDYTSASGAFVVRLVTSADEGKTWRVADAQLAQQGVSVCLFRADATGTAVYAEVSANGCVAGSAASDTLWRSDDAGAHWRKAGSLPSKDALLLDVLHGADPQHPMLLSTGAADVSYTLPVLSHDDGATWQQTPTKGLPPKSTFLPLQTTMLTDGTLFAPFLDTAHSSMTGLSSSWALAYYALGPGATSWHQVTPEVTITGLLLYAIAQGGGTPQSSFVTIVSQSDGYLGTPDAKTSVVRCGLALGGAGG